MTGESIQVPLIFFSNFDDELMTQDFLSLNNRQFAYLIRIIL